MARKKRTTLTADHAATVESPCVDVEDDVEARAEPAPRTKLSLSLTVTQLKHLRDVLSIIASPGSTRTLSQVLAENEERPTSEALLWSKIAQLCATVGVSLDDDAPDFMIVMCRPPELTVVRVEQDDEFESDD